VKVGWSIQHAEITLGVLAGLVIGKPLGIMAAALLGVRSGVAKLPAAVGWAPLLGYASLAGIGFTMSLFIAMLAFDGTGSVDAAKQGILVGSLLAAVAAAVILKAASHSRHGQKVAHRGHIAFARPKFCRERARRYLLEYFVSIRHRCTHFRNIVVAPERAGIWQFGMGCSVNSLQFHGGAGFGKRARGISDNSAVATALFVRCAGDLRRVFRVHDRLWTSTAWQLDASRLANALELPAHSAWAALCRLFSDPARANDSHGFDLAGND